MEATCSSETLVTFKGLYYIISKDMGLFNVALSSTFMGCYNVLTTLRTNIKRKNTRDIREYFTVFQRSDTFMKAAMFTPSTEFRMAAIGDKKYVVGETFNICHGCQSIRSYVVRGTYTHKTGLRMPHGDAERKPWY
jgi:hypothetical protein